jgi:hypothetical protein
MNKKETTIEAGNGIGFFGLLQKRRKAARKRVEGVLKDYCFKEGWPGCIFCAASSCSDSCEFKLDKKLGNAIVEAVGAVGDPVKELVRMHSYCGNCACTKGADGHSTK